MKSELINPVTYLKRCIELFTHEPFGTTEWIPLKSVYVPRKLLRSRPNDCKIKEYCKRFVRRGFIDVPLTVHKYDDYKLNHQVELLDGYIRYLICAFKKVKYVPVRYR